MCGNVWEWVDADQKPTPDFLKRMQRGLDPTLTLEDAFYVIRGGYFTQKLSPGLLSDTSPFPAKLGAVNIGFRCAKTPDTK
jgi:formylglycine-generating enzyme required for sulfatase activity